MKIRNAAITIVGLFLILVVTLAVFNLPVFDSLKLMASGAFGNIYGITRTAVKATPLLLTGLGMVVAWRAGMYNIGGEGQFLLGGVFGAAFAKWFANVQPHLETAFILVGAVLGGALWASLAAWLFVKRGVNVVISTILLNFVAIQFLGWAVNGPLQQSKHQLPLSDELPDAVMLWRPDRQLDFHAGTILAVVVAIGLYILIYRTSFGFKLRLVGANDRAARANRINASAIHFRALAISGALCGLAGGVEFAGISGTLGEGFSQGWGFMAIPVALLGGLHPIGVIASAIFFGAVFAGSENLARFTSGGTTLIYVIQGVAVLGFVALRSYTKKRELAVEAT